MEISKLIEETIKALKDYQEARETASDEEREKKYAYFCGLRKAVCVLGYRKALTEAMENERG